MAGTTLSRQYYQVEFSKEGLSEEDYNLVLSQTLADENKLANNIRALAFWYNHHLPYDYDSMLEAMESMTEDQWVSLYRTALLTPPHKKGSKPYAGYTPQRIDTAREIFVYWLNNPEDTLSEIAEQFGWRSHASAQNYITAGAPLNGMIPAFSKGKEKISADDEFVDYLIWEIYNSGELLPHGNKHEFVHETATKALRRHVVRHKFGLEGSPSDNRFFPLIRAQSNYSKHWSSDFGGKSTIITDVRRAISLIHKDEIGSEQRLPLSDVTEPHAADIEKFRITPNQYDAFWSKRDYLGVNDHHPVLKATAILRHAQWDEVLRVAVYGSDAPSDGVEANLLRIRNFARRHNIDATEISNALVINLSDNPEERSECTRLLSIASLMDDGEMMQPQPALLGASDLLVELEERFGEDDDTELDDESVEEAI